MSSKKESWKPSLKLYNSRFPFTVLRLCQWYFGLGLPRKQTFEVFSLLDVLFFRVLLWPCWPLNRLLRNDVFLLYNIRIAIISVHSQFQWREGQACLKFSDCNVVCAMRAFLAQWFQKCSFRQVLSSLLSFLSWSPVVCTRSFCLNNYHSLKIHCPDSVN